MGLDSPSITSLDGQGARRHAENGSIFPWAALAPHRCVALAGRRPLFTCPDPVTFARSAAPWCDTAAPGPCASKRPRHAASAGRDHELSAERPAIAVARGG